MALSQFPDVQHAVDAVQEILTSPYGSHIRKPCLIGSTLNSPLFLQNVSSLLTITVSSRFLKQGYIETYYCLKAMSAINHAGLVDKEYPVKDSLFFKIQGSDDIVKATTKVIQQIIKKHGSTMFTFAATDAEAATLWESRKYALTSTIASDPGSHAWTTDVWLVHSFRVVQRCCKHSESNCENVSVPVSKLPHLVQETKKDIAENGLKAGIVGHVGDGKDVQIAYSYACN